MVETWEEWLQHSRIELNAFTSAQLIDWLDRKMGEHGAGKLIPPDDILQDEFGERVRERAQSAVADGDRAALEDQIAAIEAEQAEATKEIRAEIDRITADLRMQLARVSEPFLRNEDRALRKSGGRQAIDREAEVHQVDRADHRPTRTSCGRQSAKPSPANRRCTGPTVLHEIADGTEVGDVDAEAHHEHVPEQVGEPWLERPPGPFRALLRELARDLIWARDGTRSTALYILFSRSRVQW